jgi:predicted PurR-regulated permease PerM
LALLSPPPQISNKFISAATTLIAVATSVALLYYGRNFFITFIISALIAFILDPAVVLVMKLRLPRSVATPVVIGFAFAVIYFSALLLWTQVAILSEDMPTYASRVSEIVDKTNSRLDDLEKQAIASVIPKSFREQEQQIQQKPQQAMKARRKRAVGGTPPAATTDAPLPPQEVTIHQEPKPIITSIYGYVSSYFHVMIMASFVPFLVYFMLSWRDRIALSFLGLFKGEERYSVERAWTGVGDSTRAYVVGNFFLWFFLSSASAIVFFFLGVPYWPLIGTISATFSLLPYVGLPLSIIPPVLAAIAIPNKFKIVLLIVVFTAALHIVCMNFLYAKIIGRRVRLNPLAVTVALMFWGAVWGGIGLILAVPITAAVKAVCDNVKSLHPYGNLLGD